MYQWPDRIYQTELNQIRKRVIRPIIEQARTKIFREEIQQKGIPIPVRPFKQFRNEILDDVERSLSIYFRMVGAKVTMKRIRGEMKHTPILHSSEWETTHEWMCIDFGHGVRLYVDPTCDTFCDLFRDVPIMYVSSNPPRWYLPEDQNFALGKHPKLNQYIRFPVRRNRKWTSFGICEVLDYYVWGFFSDVIHRIINPWNRHRREIHVVSTYE